VTYYNESRLNETRAMSAVVAQKGPYLQELAPGDYLWCACGRSASQPWCDGSHAKFPNYRYADMIGGLFLLR
jgi:CDGSH-type Zn-finger protein